MAKLQQRKLLAEEQKDPLAPVVAQTPEQAPPSNNYSADKVYEWSVPDFGHVKFTEHLPVAFGAIREFFGYSREDLEEELALPMTVKNTDGKSDALFLRSKSGRFLLKSLRGSEPDNLKNFIPSYIPFIQENEDTLLPRYLGLFTFEWIGRRVSNSTPGASHASTLHNPFAFGSHNQHLSLPSRSTFMMIPNIFDTTLPIDLKFDFKGSTVGRRAMKPAELLKLFDRSSNANGAPVSSSASSRGSASQDGYTVGIGGHAPEMLPDTIVARPDIGDITLKELDFSRLVNEKLASLFYLGPQRRMWLIDRLQKDTDLLRQHEFMDYSLLIGVHIHHRSDAFTSEHDKRPSNLEPVTVSLATEKQAPSAFDRIASFFGSPLNSLVRLSPTPTPVPAVHDDASAELHGSSSSSSLDSFSALNTTGIDHLEASTNLSRSMADLELGIGSAHEAAATKETGVVQNNFVVETEPLLGQLPTSSEQTHSESGLENSSFGVRSEGLYSSEIEYEVKQYHEYCKRAICACLYLDAPRNCRCANETECLRV
eukprot:jgi/Hompol1/514/HPOL_002382-RA